MKPASADDDRILRERAQSLARRPVQAAPSTGATLDLLEFGLARERYALERRHVQEVCPLRDLTPLPGTPPFLLGIVNVRGRIVPVLDLKRFFELPEHGLTDLHRIILVRGNDMEIGVLADTIGESLQIAAASLEPSLPTLSGIRAQYLKGVSAERIVVLDIDQILADPAIVVHQSET